MPKTNRRIIKVCLGVRCPDCDTSGRMQSRFLAGQERQAVRDAQKIFLTIHRALGCPGLKERNAQEVPLESGGIGEAD
jgi:hypothetical protein